MKAPHAVNDFTKQTLEALGRLKSQGRLTRAETESLLTQMFDAFKQELVDGYLESLGEDATPQPTSTKPTNSPEHQLMKLSGKF